MNRSDFRLFIRKEAQIIMSEKIKKDKFSSFEDDFVVYPKNHKRVVGKNNKDVFVNSYSIKYLMRSFETLIQTNTVSIAGEVKMDSYDPKKKTIKYNNVKVPVKVINQLERVGVHHFGEY